MASMSRADSPSELPSPVDDDIDEEPILNVGHFMMTPEGQLKDGLCDAISKLLALSPLPIFKHK